MKHSDRQLGDPTGSCTVGRWKNIQRKICRRNVNQYLLVCSRKVLYIYKSESLHNHTLLSSASRVGSPVASTQNIPFSQAGLLVLQNPFISIILPIRISLRNNGE